MDQTATLNAPELAQLATLKRGARATWAAGDYHAIAERQLWEVGERVVARAHVAPQEQVLDVACGTGNAALRAAKAGADVVGLDLTPELLETGRELAEQAGLQVTWVQGDAEELPFEDESFDVVLSTFGCIFAPRHRVVAGELARVLRPGGRVAVTAWAPDGAMGEFFRTVGGYLPPPPPIAEAPALWGTEEHVRELFDGSGVELGFERDTVAPLQFESAEQALDVLASSFGPVMMARELTEAAGRWTELREQLVELYDRGEHAEYLVTLGRKERS
jgi:SAM-dependent methyltransferase